jgi:hypothetical protein
MTGSSADILGEAIFDRVAECRKQLHEGKADLAGVEDGVRAYCEAVAALPADESRKHAEKLSRLTEAMEALGGELTKARDLAQDELQAFDRLRKASNAYLKSDAMGRQYIQSKKKAPS